MSILDMADAIARVKAANPLPDLIGRDLDLQRDGRHLVALCPFHGEKTPSFHVYGDHFHCFGCGAHGDAIGWTMRTQRLAFPAAVAALDGGSSAGRSMPRPIAVKAPARQHGVPASVFMRVWNEGRSPAGTLVETYLGSRGGLTVPDGADLRFHPRCQRGSRDTPGGPEFLPAMLALLTDPISGQPVGLHRTYLTPDGSGKAPVTKRGAAKMVLGSWGVIRLVPDTDISRAIGIAEGVENALTVMQLAGWGPTWAAGCRGTLQSFPVLPWAEAVTIFADSDDSGEGLAAARACATRWNSAGREAIIHAPPAGTDWNDLAGRLLA